MCMNEVAEQPCGQKMAVEAGQSFLRELVEATWDVPFGDHV